MLARGSFRVIGEAGPPPSSEPVGRAGKSSAVDQTPEEALDLLLLLQWPLLGTGEEGLREGKDLHRGFTRARNLTWYLKVSFGIRLEAQVMVSCVTTPLQWSLGGLLFLLSVSETFLIHVDPWTLCPLLRLSFLPCLVAMVSHRPCDGCCEHNAGTEAGSWGSAGFLYSGRHPTESLRRQQSCTPCVLATGPCTSPLVPSSPAVLAVRTHPTPCGLRVGLPSNTDHSSATSSPKGLDFLSGLFVLKQWRQIKARQGPGPLLV